MNLFYEKNRDIPGIYIEKAKNTRCLQHFHNSVEMLYMIEGSFHLIVDGKEYFPKTNEVIFIPPLSTHVINNADSISITLTIPNDLLSPYHQIVNKRIFPVILNDIEYNKNVLLPHFDKIMKEHTVDNPFLQYSIVYSLFSNMYARYPLIEKNLGKDANLIIQIINYLNENFKEPLTLETLAKEFHYSKFYFSKLFDKHFNCTLKYYLNTLRVNYVAENLGKTTNTSLIELIYESGFTSVSTFYRHFNLIFKTSPKNYFKKN